MEGYMPSLDYLLSLLITYKYAFLFPTLMVEGPGISILAAFLSSPGGGMIFNVWVVLFIVMAVDICADTFYYSIGRWGKNWLVSRYPKRFSLSPDRFRKLERYFNTHTVKTLVMGKISHALGWTTMVAAGSARVPYQKFFTINLVVSIIKSIVFVSLGYYFGTHYELLLQYFGKVGLIATFLMVVVVSYYIFRKGKKNLSM